MVRKRVRKNNKKVPKGKNVMTNKTLTREIRKLKKMPELKYVNNPQSFNPDYTGAIFPLCNVIAQGQTDNGTRIGDKIRCYRLTIRGRVIGNSTSTTTQQNVRVIVFRFMDEKGTLPVVGNILQYSAAPEIIFSNYTWDYQKSRKILHDKVYSVASDWNSALNTPGYQSERLFKINLPLHMFRTDYNAGTATVNNNGLYILYCSDVNATLPQLNIYWRLTYSDS